MLSKTSKYGIKAAIYVANQSLQGKRVGVPEIASSINSPQHFVGKIVQQLAKSGILNSIKGPNGGFEMTEAQLKNNNIKNIVEVLDGPDLYTKCALGLDNCNDAKPCPVHFIYTNIRKSILQMHTDSSLEDLAKKLDDMAYLK